MKRMGLLSLTIMIYVAEVCANSASSKIVVISKASLSNSEAQQIFKEFTDNAIKAKQDLYSDLRSKPSEAEAYERYILSDTHRFELLYKKLSDYRWNRNMKSLFESEQKRFLEFCKQNQEIENMLQKLHLNPQIKTSLSVNHAMKDKVVDHIIGESSKKRDASWWTINNLLKVCVAAYAFDMIPFTNQSLQFSQKVFKGGALIATGGAITTTGAAIGLTLLGVSMVGDNYVDSAADGLKKVGKVDAVTGTVVAVTGGIAYLICGLSKLGALCALGTSAFGLSVMKKGITIIKS